MLLSNTQQHSAILSNALRLSAMLCDSQQCFATLSNALQLSEPLFWPVQQRSAAVEHNTGRVAHISISHVSLTPYLAEWFDIGEEILILL